MMHVNAFFGVICFFVGTAVGFGILAFLMGVKKQEASYSDFEAGYKKALQDQEAARRGYVD